MRLPAAEELVGEDLADEGARVLERAHLDVALVQQLVAHAPSAGVHEPPARARAPFTTTTTTTVVVVALRRVAQQGVVLLTGVEVVIVELPCTSSSTPTSSPAAEIHGWGGEDLIIQQSCGLINKEVGMELEKIKGRREEVEEGGWGVTYHQPLQHDLRRLQAELHLHGRSLSQYERQ